MPTQTKKSVERNAVEYECLHVLSTLMDDVIEGYLQFTNYTTEDVLSALISMQQTKNWRLGDVDFERYFHYSFENENGLLAPILSIAEPFDESFEFTFDTSTHPWTLNLLRPSDDVTSEVRWRKDMRSFDEYSDPSEIANYIIPKGNGEGVNMLSIEDVNGGKRYLKDDESIAKWGKRPYIWVDRRFKDAESLKASAEARLKKWKEPKISFDLDAIDLSVLPEYAQERRLLNGVVRIIVEDKEYFGRIIEENIADLSREYEVDYKISDHLDDISTMQADAERKQQVNEAYSQGATNIMTFGYQDNCDDKVPAVIPFYIDDDVVNVNTLELTFRTKKFRAYSEATGGGGATVRSTKSGGSSTATSSSGGGTTATSSSGGGTTATSSSGGGTSTTSGSGGGTSKSTAGGGSTTRTASTGGGHRHNVVNIPGAGASVQTETAGTHSHSVSIPSHTHGFSTPNHTHSISIKSHTHNVKVPSHKHDVKIPNHTHKVDIPAHKHDIELPNHTHEVEHKIIELSDVPSKVTIKVDGEKIPFDSNAGDRIDLLEYLEKDDGGKVVRGRHEVEILPDGLARIEADLIARVFIQSQLGGTY